jgi:hypothetical protein
VSDYSRISDAWSVLQRVAFLEHKAKAELSRVERAAIDLKIMRDRKDPATADEGTASIEGIALDGIRVDGSPPRAFTARSTTLIRRDPMSLLRSTHHFLGTWQRPRRM